MTDDRSPLATPDDVLDALRENDARPYGRQRTVTAEELVEAADQFDDPKLHVLALLELMEAYEYDGERRKSPVVFARVLKLWDSDPESFTEWAAQQVFWRFKWVATALLNTPEVPLDAVRRWLDEMRERYTKAGHDLQPYWAQRYQLARHTGTGEADAFDLWATRPRSRLSDCAACELRDRADHHVRAGDDERALREWQPVLAGDQGCSEEPYTSHAHSLLPLLRLGRTDEARSGHLVGYRYARGRTAMTAAVGLHLEFCALTGNEPRGLEILAENRDLLAVTGDAAGRLGLLTGVHQLLARLVALGHGDTAVSGPPGSSWTAATLLAHVAAEGEALAARFDARNGTGAVGDRRRAALARQPLLDRPLALGVRAAAAATVTAPVPAPRPAAEPAPEDFTALVLRARELLATGHPDADRLWDRAAERYEADPGLHTDAVGPVARLRAEIAERRAHALVDAGRYAEAAERLAAVAGLFEQAGMPGHALLVRTRALVAHLGDGDGAPVDWPALDEALRAAEAMPAGVLDPDDRLVLLQCRAFAAHHDLTGALGDDDAEVPAALTERFTATVTAYRSAAEAAGSARRTALARQFTADLAARQGRTAEALTELRAVLAQLEAAELPWVALRPLGLLGQVLLHHGEPAEAAETFHRALAGAARWGDDDFPVAATQLMLGHALAVSGEPEAAVRALSEAADRYDRAGRTGDAAEARLQLAGLLRGIDRTGDAVAVLDSVLADPATAGLDARLLAQLRLDLARGLHELEEYRDAAEEYLRLADAVAGWEEQDTHTMAAAEAAVALASAGHWEAAHTACERALASHERAPRTDQIAAMLREFARLTMAAEGPDGLAAALAHLDRADALPDAGWYRTGASHYERARTHAVADRPAEALACAERAVAAYDGAGPDGERPRAEAVRLAAVLEGDVLDRPDAARARLVAAAARARAAGHPDAADVLTALHDRLGG
ncbi:hypothetical protein ACWGB8_02730 [Kitasatospora sp. NPDC054939]